MRNNFKIFMYACVLTAPFALFADVQYTTLAPLPNIPTNPTVNEGFLSVYLNNLYMLGIALCTGLAVLMIVVGGVQWASSDAWSAKKDGKEKIWSAILGLLVALGSWVILNTVNPDLLDTRLELGQDVTTGGIPTNPGGGTTNPGGGTGTPNTPGTPGTPTNPPGTPPTIPPGKSEQEVRDYMAQNGIAINNANPCVPPQTKGCTNLAGLGDAAMTGVVELKNASGAPITITGGTEPGHVTHGVGESIVDIRKNTTLDNYVVSNAASTSSGSRGTWYTMSNGDRYLNEGDHWHVEFK